MCAFVCVSVYVCQCACEWISENSSKSYMKSKYVFNDISTYSYVFQYISYKNVILFMWQQ